MREPLVGGALARGIRARTKRILKASRRALRRGRGERLHGVRIAFKRLRYTLEFLVPLSTQTAPALDALALVQERLGTIADADAFARTYDELLAGLCADDERRPGLEMLRERTALERTAAVDALRALWKGGPSTVAYPETLAASISDALGSISPKDA